MDMKSRVAASDEQDTKGLMQDLACDKCDFSTVFKSTLDWHKRKIHGPNIRKFPCDRCEYSAGNEHRLKGHKATVHEKIKPFNCHLCDHAASNWSNIDKHIKVVHEKIKPFHCTNCPYSGSSRGNLECHIRKHHANQIVSNADSKVKLLQATPRGSKTLELLQNTTKYENVVEEEVDDAVAPMQTVWLTSAQ